MLQGIERFMKQALVEKQPSVASAALVSSLKYFHLNKEVVKRWVNEVQEALNSKGNTTQYHALGLIYMIKQNDRMAIIKLIQSLAKGNIRSPYSHCMLIRIIVKIMEDEEPDHRSMFDLLADYVRNRNEMVIFEAAKGICSLKNVTSKELAPAISALQLFLVNHKPTLRFAAVRALSKIAMSNPAAVWPCNMDMEALVNDANRSVATYAITTLLKTGTEASVDRLMKQINSFMSEITDEFKVIVVDAVRSLCLKFPAKHSLMLNFLAQTLRDEGGFEFKSAIVDAMFDIINTIPESKEPVMSHLCEFVEDCEFTKIAVRILHLLGVEGPKALTPSKYIRYIYNRVILENSAVRAAAVTALTKFASAVPELRERILVLLTR
jgi:coatomer protein complex subunit gamma